MKIKDAQVNEKHNSKKIKKQKNRDQKIEGQNKKAKSRQGQP